MRIAVLMVLGLAIGIEFYCPRDVWTAFYAWVVLLAVACCAFDHAIRRQERARGTVADQGPGVDVMRPSMFSVIELIGNPDGGIQRQTGRSLLTWFIGELGPEKLSWWDAAPGFFVVHLSVAEGDPGNPKN